MSSQFCFSFRFNRFSYFYNAFYLFYFLLLRVCIPVDFVKDWDYTYIFVVTLKYHAVFAIPPSTKKKVS